MEHVMIVYDCKLIIGYILRLSFGCMYTTDPHPLFFPFFSCCAGGKPDDITVLLSIVAEYTDWKCVCVSVCVSVCTLLWGWSSLLVCRSLPPAALAKTALHPVGWQGRPNSTTLSSLQGRHPPVYILSFLPLFLFWRLNGWEEAGS